MGKINVLSFAVANLIAAGEVVDRPASVIKELMENAVDAGSTRITIEIQNGGVTFMRVSDNGCGMSAEDLPIAVRRHATSKIREAEDLDGILTLGFRGEALAAIASVSHLRIFSKPHGAPLGAMLESYGGENVTMTELGCSDGTTVIVEDLFANVPARRKFLKKDATEAMAVTANVEKVALSRPDIAFRLIVDGNVRLETAGDGDLRHAVYAVFGREFASRLIEINSGEENGIRVSGFISRPDNVKSNRNFQNYFINGRYVKSKTACAAVEQAYCSYMPPEKFPCCVLNLQITPAAVDVNVHPAKLEVKFSNEKPVFEAIYYAVRNALEQDRQRPDVKLAQGHISVEEARRMLAETQPVQKPRVSDATVPIREGRAESLKKQQIKMEIPTATLPHKEQSQARFSAFQPTERVHIPSRPAENRVESEKSDMPRRFIAPPVPEFKPLREQESTTPSVSRETPTTQVERTPEQVLEKYIRDYEAGRIIRADEKDPEKIPLMAEQSCPVTNEAEQKTEVTAVTSTEKDEKKA
ncbi:MAG: DNA mismatch repair endonuclease MutL, partial [Clostridia bacterium]|nr:DNA mismatch repair endonuclease MutL [Clostridia bacterium]